MPPAEFRKDWKLSSIEGFLFPATYEFTKLTSSPRLVSDQLRAFRRSWRKVDLRYARSKNLTPYDVLIIASMIEKETVVASERRLVAAVIYNRLRNRMPLGIDATIRYGRDVPGTEPLKQSDIESDSPYNTRRRLGLPPTPIANPGLASMRAAAIRRTSTTSTSCASARATATSSRRARRSSARSRSSTATAAADASARRYFIAVSGISGTTTLVGIIGWPVAHSLSPRMHNAAFAALGLDWAYVPLADAAGTARGGRARARSARVRRART